MKIVVDTNLVFSAILNSNGKIGDLLLNSATFFTFYSPNFLRLEIEKHWDKLLRISKLTPMQLEESKFQIFGVLHFLAEEQIPYEYWHNALPYVREVDMDDIAFVALSGFLNSRLWTGDKELREALLSKGFSQGLSTDELYHLREDSKKAN